ncbi:MAG: hypothetical protein H3C43_14155, partial [Leptonema sp. (in: Bacteria)]|nr:hypothetical protein [Leptonema sp. (in: bacteria)]
MIQRIQNFLLNQTLPRSNSQEAEFELRLWSASFWVSVIFSAILASIFVRQNRSFTMSLLEQTMPMVQNIASSIYPVLMEQLQPTEPIPGQIRAYSSVTSGGRGGITAESGFHTLSSDDTLFVSLQQEAQLNFAASEAKKAENTDQVNQSSQFDFSGDFATGDAALKKNQSSQNQDTATLNEVLPMRIP